MGGGAWTSTSAVNFMNKKYASYSTVASACSLDALTTLDTHQIYD